MFLTRVCTTAFLFLIAGMLALSAASAHEANAVERSLQFNSLERTLIEYEMHEFDQASVRINEEEYVYLGLPNCAFVENGEAGQPQLPRLTESLMIPDAARMEVRVVSSDYHEIEGINIVPSKGTICRTVDPASVPYIFGPEYSENSFYPGSIATLRDPFVMRDVRGVVVEVYPFQYNPVTKVLRVYDSITVEVFSAGPVGENPVDRSVVTERPSKSFELMYANQFSNYPNPAGRTEPPSEEGDMLIICHGPFMTAMQPFVDWKNSIGINTTIVDVATIGNNYTAIGNYIDDVYNTSNLSFVLLVGDANEVKSNPYNYSVSDPDYSTITADWYPDILVGRFSATTVAHVETQVERTIAYEQEGHDVTMGGWNAAALGVASNQGAGIGHYGESDDDHMDLMMDELTGYGFTTITKSYDYWGTKTIIRNALNDGVRTAQYTGHGSPTSWGNGGGFSVTDVNGLTNVGKLPFIVSVACNVGEFDYGTCFCEAWMRAEHNGEPAGAIAHYGSVISQSWAPPMYGQGNHNKSGNKGALERFWIEHNWSIGAQWFGGSCIMMDLVGSSGRTEFRGWTVFGDPSLRTYGSSGSQSLTADAWTIPVSAPVQVDFTIDLGLRYADYKYVLLSGVTGTAPGKVLPGGLEVPLNFDVWTYFCLFNMNALSLFTGFTGELDSTGIATATLDTTGHTPMDPSLLGYQMYFAAVAWESGGPYERATNACALTFVE